MTVLELEWHASILASKESVSVEIARWAKRRIMNNKNRLEGLFGDRQGRWGGRRLRQG